MPIFFKIVESRSNLFLALLITIFFFAISYAITPWSLYPGVTSYFSKGGGNAALLYPTGTTITPEPAIYARAMQSLVPWATLSPLVPISIQFEQCESFGCLFLLLFQWVELILIFVVYTFFVFSLLKSIRTGNYKRRRILLALLFIIWLGFMSVGVSRVNKYYIDPPRHLNSFLEQLAAVSHKNPFPDGTEIKEFLYSNTWGFNDFSSSDIGISSRSNIKTASLVMNLYYRNPRNVKERYNITIIFGGTAPSISCPNSRNGQSNAREVVPSIWRCDGIWDIANKYMLPFKEGEFRPYKKFMGFLDLQHTIFITTEPIIPEKPEKEVPDPIPTFFAYYR